jgi:hypothetical protein
MGEEGMRLLYNLRNRIVQVLKSHRITVLSEQDQQRAVPWLRLARKSSRKKDRLR